jgi:uncharacterized membrane protein YgcG
MTKRKKNNKVTAGHKVTLGAVSVLGLVGGWNFIGHVENTAATEEAPTEVPATPTPTTVPPTPTPWSEIQPLAQIPRLEVKAVPTLVVNALPGGQADPSIQTGQQTAVSFDLAAVPVAAPLPTLAPLPSLPQYVPPPPPPPSQANSSSNKGGGGGSSSNNNSGGGGNTSKGS